MSIKYTMHFRVAPKSLKNSRYNSCRYTQAFFAVSLSSTSFFTRTLLTPPSRDNTTCVLYEDVAFHDLLARQDFLRQVAKRECRLPSASGSESGPFSGA